MKRSIQSALRLSIGLSAVLSLLTACGKHEAAPFVEGDFLMIKPGNYWIYQSFDVDSNGYGAPGGVFGGDPVLDSVYATTDTVLHGRIYHRIRQPIALGSMAYATLYLRDSLGYVVDQNGGILFSSTDSTTVFYAAAYPNPDQPSSDSAISEHYQRGPRETVVTPAGIFETVPMIWRVTYHPFSKDGSGYRHRYRRWRYAPGIGLASQTMESYTWTSRTIERRLFRYSVSR